MHQRSTWIASSLALILVIIIGIGIEPIIVSATHHHREEATTTKTLRYEHHEIPLASPTADSLPAAFDRNNGTLPDGIIMMGNRELHLMAYGGIGVCVFFVW